MNILGFEDALKIAARMEVGLAIHSSDRGRLKALLHEVRQRTGDPAYLNLEIIFSATEHDVLLILRKPVAQTEAP